MVPPAATTGAAMSPPARRSPPVSEAFSEVPIVPSPSSPFSVPSWSPPPPPPSLPPVKDSHVDLMEEIRRGGTLRHVSPEKLAPAGGGDTRGELLGQIRQGVTLKRVVDNIPAPGGGGDLSSGEPPAASGIAGLLQRALQERGMVMGMSSSEGESDGCDDDDEWDD